jgi:hypothetical protein
MFVGWGGSLKAVLLLGDKRIYQVDHRRWLIGMEKG